MKTIINDLKKEVYQVKKKLKKIEDEFQKSKKSYAEAAIKINCLCQSFKQLFKEYIIKKYHLSEELEETKKCASEMS